MAQTALGIVTAPGPGRQPLVQRFQFGVSIGGLSYSVTQSMAYDAGFLGGVNVVGRDNGFITGAGPGGGPHVRIWEPVGFFDVKVSSEFFAFDPAFTGGVFVG